MTPHNTEFHEKMLSIDKELAKKGVPVYERAFQAFPIAAPDYRGPLMGAGIDRSTYGEYEGPNLLDKIHNWYKQVYGKRASAARDLGKVPIIIRDEIYLVRIPLVYATPEINILPFIEGLTPRAARRLSVAELDEIQNKFTEGYSLEQEFEDLYSPLDTENGAKIKNNPFLDSALQDRDAAVDCLDKGIDTNGAVFYSQQLAEKMLKAVLFHLANMSEEEITQKYGHSIADIYKDVTNYAESPVRISSEINYISQYEMDIRDSDSQVSDSDAVKAFWAGFRIGGFCAALLSGHERAIQS